MLRWKGVAWPMWGHRDSHHLPPGIILRGIPWHQILAYGSFWEAAH